jgi:hypothetical protein
MPQNEVTPPPKATPANKGVKQGLPSLGLPTAEEWARKLWDVARLGMAAKEAFAQQFRRRASGSAWDTQLALLRGFQLIKSDGDQIGLSELGQQLVNSSDPAKQLTARRTAVMNLKAYNTLVTSFDGTELPEKSVLASRLKFDYGKTEDFAERAAQAFIDSLDHAGMLDTQKVICKDGATPGVPAPATSPTNDGDQDSASEIDRAFDAAESADEYVAAEPKQQDLAIRSDQAGDSQTISLTITLDLSKYDAADTIQILQALGLTHHD